MVSRDALLDEISKGEAAGLAIALALLATNHALLPAAERRLSRQPALFLLGHLVVLAFIRGWPHEARTHHALAMVAILLLLAAIGRGAVVFALDVVLGRRMQRPLPKIFRDLTQAVVYVVAAVATLHTAGIDPGSILTTSALLTAVIGLSLQETLGNLFAGLAIQLQKPFDLGDWIQFDDHPAHVGRVLEISWRATKVLTADDVEIIIPNGALGKSQISNFSKPKPRTRRTVKVTLPTSLPPRHAQRVLESAIAGAWGVLEEPKVVVVTQRFADSGVEYSVRFFTDRFHEHELVDGGVLDRIWYALAREGIALPNPTRDVFLHEINEETIARSQRAEVATRIAWLRRVDFLAVLPDEDLARLAQASIERLYATGETVITRGETGSELFVVKGGAVRVLVPGRGDELTEVARLEAGAFFGEMALMTGEPRNATVVAAEDAGLLVLRSEDVKSVLDAHPQLAETMSHALAERQAKLEAHSAEAQTVDEQAVDRRSLVILERVRRFFSLRS